jgi:hypothetical protein|tara:strand:- start:20425 stop:21351 length:927 start_codon:yes stop_codon:yes gene_type:complete
MTLPLPFPAASIVLDYGETRPPYSPGSPHNGLDFSSRSRGVVAGAIIRASGRGRVLRSGWEPGSDWPTFDRPNRNAGDSIDVLYDNGVMVRYMHRPHDDGPKVGDRTQPGTVLGRIGATGLVTGPHLHMETWNPRTRQRVSPWGYFNRSTVTAAATDSTPFEEDEMNSEQDKMLRALYQELLPGEENEKTPGVIAGYIAETLRNSRDIKGTSQVAQDTTATILAELRELLPGKAGVRGQGATNAHLVETLKGVRALLARDGVDSAKVAAELAPHLAGLVTDQVGALSDDDVARLAAAVADEQARRLAG